MFRQSFTGCSQLSEWNGMEWNDHSWNFFLKIVAFFFLSSFVQQINSVNYLRYITGKERASARGRALDVLALFSRLVRSFNESRMKRVLQQSCNDVAGIMIRIHTSKPPNLTYCVEECSHFGLFDGTFLLSPSLSCSLETPNEKIPRNV